MAEEQVKQFGSRDRRPIAFVVDDDTFYAHPVMAAGKMMSLASMKDELNDADMAEKLNVILKAFEPMLLPDSYELMTDRLVSDTNPIGLVEIMEVFEWLTGEVYAKRPTRPLKSSGSSSKKSSDGKNSTVGVLPVASTPSV